MHKSTHINAIRVRNVRMLQADADKSMVVAFQKQFPLSWSLLLHAGPIFPWPVIEPASAKQANCWVHTPGPRVDFNLYVQVW